MGACEGVELREQSSNMAGGYLLKKYWRPAGERSQVKNWEAMDERVEGGRLKPPSQLYGGPQAGWGNVLTPASAYTGRKLLVLLQVRAILSSSLFFLFLPSLYSSFCYENPTNGIQYITARIARMQMGRLLGGSTTPAAALTRRWQPFLVLVLLPWTI